MKDVPTKAKPTTIFFDPYAQRQPRPQPGAYAPYFHPAPMMRAPPRHVVEPARKPETDRE